jgi:enoyl-CoA hydratase/carnithine racemase
MADSDPVRTETQGAVRIITLNRPDKRNAISSALSAALFHALEDADADPSVHVMLLTGADPAFCAGVDLKEAAEGGAAYFDKVGDWDGINRVGRSRKPVIGVINGAAITGGLEIALGCDWLIASDRAVFADTHARVGVMPGGGLTIRLPQSVGLRRALEMSLTNRLIGAEEAMRIGLVNEVVPHDELMTRALELGATVAELDPRLSAHLKGMYVEASQATAGEALSREGALAKDAGIAYDELATRRDAVMERNRAQIPKR